MPSPDPAAGSEAVVRSSVFGELCHFPDMSVPYRHHLPFGCLHARSRRARGPNPRNDATPVLTSEKPKEAARNESDRLPDRSASGNREPTGRKGLPGNGDTYAEGTRLAPKLEEKKSRARRGILPPVSRVGLLQLLKTPLPRSTSQMEAPGRATAPSIAMADSTRNRNTATGGYKGQRTGVTPVLSPEGEKGPSRGDPDTSTRPVLADRTLLSAAALGSPAAG